MPLAILRSGSRRSSACARTAVPRRPTARWRSCARRIRTSSPRSSRRPLAEGRLLELPPFSSGLQGRAPEHSMKKPVNVAITGAAGQIGYALAFRVAAGDMLGADQPVNLHLLEITPALPALQGVVMELNDCAFPTLNKIVPSDDPKIAFKDCEVALLVGARPRGPGMERKDLLLANAQIFSVQGKALEHHANRNVRVLVVGNPANTNALIAQRNAPGLNQRNFTAMVRLDHNRALAQLAEKTGSHITRIRKPIIWG